MKKHWKVLTGLVLCMTLMIGMVVTGHFKSPLHLFHTQKYNQEAAAGTYTFPSSYNSKKHLVVLEVVPDYSYAQLSYGMKGAEPIDMMAACQNGDAEKVKSLFGDDMFTTYSPGSKISEDMYEEILSQYFNNNTETSEHKNLLGMKNYNSSYPLVTDENNKFNMVENYDFSDLELGHLDYRKNFGKILKRINFY